MFMIIHVRMSCLLPWLPDYEVMTDISNSLLVSHVRSCCIFLTSVT